MERSHRCWYSFSFCLQKLYNTKFKEMQRLTDASLVMQKIKRDKKDWVHGCVKLVGEQQTTHLVCLTALSLSGSMSGCTYGWRQGITKTLGKGLVPWAKVPQQCSEGFLAPKLKIIYQNAECDTKRISIGWRYISIIFKRYQICH